MWRKSLILNSALKYILDKIKDLDFDKVEWNGEEITLYKKSEPFGQSEFISGTETYNFFILLHNFLNDYPPCIIGFKK